MPTQQEMEQEILTNMSKISYMFGGWSYTEENISSHAVTGKLSISPFVFTSEDAGHLEKISIVANEVCFICERFTFSDDRAKNHIYAIDHPNYMKLAQATSSPFFFGRWWRKSHQQFIQAVVSEQLAEVLRKLAPFKTKATIESSSSAP